MPAPPRCLFIVTSVVHPAAERSLYPPAERREQTLRTLRSVAAHAPPGARAVVVEASRPGAPAVPDFELGDGDGDGNGDARGGLEVATHRLPDADRARVAALPKSAGEATLLLAYLASPAFAAHAAGRDVAFKLSGRYELQPAFRDALPAFAAAAAAGRPAARRLAVGRDLVTVTVLFAFPPAGAGLAYVRARLEHAAKRCAPRGAPDIEHALFDDTAPEAPAQVEPLGVCGRHAPSGLYVEY